MKEVISSSHIKEEPLEKLQDLQIQSKAALLEHHAEHPQLDDEQKHYAKEELGKLAIEMARRGIQEPDFSAMRESLIERHPHLDVPVTPVKKSPRKSIGSSR